MGHNRAGQNRKDRLRRLRRQRRKERRVVYWDARLSFYVHQPSPEHEPEDRASLHLGAEWVDLGPAGEAKRRELRNRPWRHVSGRVWGATEKVS